MVFESIVHKETGREPQGKNGLQFTEELLVPDVGLQDKLSFTHRISLNRDFPSIGRGTALIRLDLSVLVLTVRH